MKNHFICLTIVASAILASCNKDTDMAGNTDLSFDRNVKINTNIDNNRELSRANFIGTDLSLTLDYGANDNAVLRTENRKWNYMAENSTWSIDGEPMLWKDNTTPVDIYAYSPYIEDITDRKKIEFRVGESQSESNISQYDLLGCTMMQYKNGDNAALTLELNHVLSQIKVNMSFGNSVGDNPNVENITINNVSTSVFYDATTATATTKEEGSNITVSKSSNGNSYTAILPAQTLKAGEFLTFNVNDKSYHYTIDNSAIHKLEPGKILTLNLQVGEQQVILSNVLIEDWTSKEITDMVATKKKWIDFAVKPAKGTGENGDPYLITNARELAWVAKEVNEYTGKGITKNLTLMNDIDLSGLEWVPIAINNTNQPYLNNSVIDGNGHSIIGMEAVCQNGCSVSGFIGYVKGGSTYIKNITFKDCKSINGSKGTGIIVGYMQGGPKIVNCHVINSYTNSAGITGGLVGQMDNNTFLYASSFDGEVETNGNYGGSLVAHSKGSYIVACHSKGKITKTSGAYVGGVLGGSAFANNITPNLLSCYTISIASTSMQFVGQVPNDGKKNILMESCYYSASSKMKDVPSQAGTAELNTTTDDHLNAMNVTIDNFLTTQSSNNFEKYHYVKNNETQDGEFPYILVKQE